MVSRDANISFDIFRIFLASHSEKICLGERFILPYERIVHVAGGKGFSGESRGTHSG